MTNNNSNKLEIQREEFDIILKQIVNLVLRSKGKETVLWDKDSLINVVNTKLRTMDITHENLIEVLTFYIGWLKENSDLNLKYDEIWAKVKNKHLITNTIIDKKYFTYSNILDYTKFLHSNKDTIISEVIQTSLTMGAMGSKAKSKVDKNKLLGRAGDINLNELITKGFFVFDIHLVKLIRENVEVSLVGSCITSIILYKTVINLYLKNTKTDSNPSLVQTRERALFLLVGVPLIVGDLLSIIKAGKLNLKIAANLEGLDSVSKTEIEGTSSISRNSLFLFLNKLPNWIKKILRYIAPYLIVYFIISVIGYKSNIIVEIYSQFDIYLGYFLKLYCILNFFVIIYFIWKLYVIVMFAHNKDFINPEDYPKFIKDDLLESKDIAVKVYSVNPEGRGKVYKHYLNFIFLYISIVLFGLSVIIYI